jgi:hypothetical protein
VRVDGDVSFAITLVVYSEVRLIMYPELLIRAIRRSSLELLAIDFEHQRLLRLFSFVAWQWYLEPKDGVLFRDSYTR